MFADIQAEVGARIMAAEQHFNATFNPDPPGVAATSKGLVFVQLYAIYEYTVKGMVREALQLMKSAAMPIQAVRWELLGLILDPEVSAVADAGKDRIWETRLRLFSRANAADALSTPDGVFPSDGTHFRLGQIYTIWALFGISAPVLPDPRLTPLIGEVVEHRNAIAHGRITAHDIGRGYSKDQIVAKIGDMQTVCAYLIGKMNEHCSVHANLSR